jgi:hypothetical protein
MPIIFRLNKEETKCDDFVGNGQHHKSATTNWAINQRNGTSTTFGGRAAVPNANLPTASPSILPIPMYSRQQLEVCKQILKLIQ